MVNSTLLPPIVGPSQYTGGVRVPLARHADLPTPGKAVQRVDGARGTAGVLRGVAGVPFGVVPAT